MAAGPEAEPFLPEATVRVLVSRHEDGGLLRRTYRTRFLGEDKHRLAHNHTR